MGRSGSGISGVAVVVGLGMVVFVCRGEGEILGVVSMIAGAKARGVLLQLANNIKTDRKSIVFIVTVP